jgi:preprotein translocase subunit YajC
MRNLRAGDEVLTTSNFVARVRDIQVQDDGQTRVSLELADGVVFTALPGAILKRLAAAPQPEAADLQEKAST